MMQGIINSSKAELFLIEIKLMYNKSSNIEIKAFDIKFDNFFTQIKILIASW